jgi:hypothetical protein
MLGQMGPRAGPQPADSYPQRLPLNEFLAICPWLGIHPEALAVCQGLGYNILWALIPIQSLAGVSNIVQLSQLPGSP